ncbi:aryl-sulfate sulfotransferase [Winogradskyella arenosi]|uniref:Putative secreted protein (Por secretion system target) n=1 Tax=Winogradskyella arenosi TaxID=533325 RepID=A0A368ZEG3_9FLAO|nr:aryl-sulfate sulfotransferase [Winogradskyella arenosi]RCW89962.1 putative secreted protein (Por secretion system target) [Winogradskyella arenosi]
MIRTLICFLVLSSNLLVAQNTIGNTLYEQGVYDGYTLFSAFTETYLINNCGEVINQWSSDYLPGNAVHLLEDGSLLRAGQTDTDDITFGGQGGVIEIRDWDGQLTWQYFYDTPNMRQHHDVFPMPNGNVLILAVTKLSRNEALNLGRDPELISQDALYNEQLIEVKPIGTNNAEIIWEWNIKDHVIQDFDPTKSNYGTISANPEKLNINFLNGATPDPNWLHFNSIYYDATLDQIIISSRNLSEVYIIDHSTSILEAASNTGGIYGKGGDFLYRWGNPQAYNQGTESDRLLYGQHSPYFIKDDNDNTNKILLFNNGRDRSPLYSEIYTVVPPTSSPGVYTYQSGTSYGPSVPEHIYGSSTGPSYFFSSILSSAQRLPNGNILICEGINGRFFEIDSNENIVWEYINPINTNNGDNKTQGTAPASFSNVSFRAIKYSTTYAAFDNNSITTGAPIESNPNTTACENLSTSDYELETTAIYPNPTTGVINIQSDISISKIEIYSLTGKKIGESRTTESIDLTYQENGVYFLKLYTANQVINKKIIKS